MLQLPHQSPTKLKRVVRPSKKAPPRRAVVKKEVPDLIKLRNDLPFFSKGSRDRDVSWWNVSPTGDYTKDLETGYRYAQAFLPLLMYNAGSASLGAIIDDMAKAGLKLRPDSKRRAIDNIALGFVLELGGIIQGLVGATAVGAAAIKSRNRKLGAEFVKLVESGSLSKGLHRSTMLHNPNASIFDKA